MNKEIEIPEGYEARIEGNKVILERKSEDEQTRQELLFFIKDEKEHTPETIPGKHWDRWITYLEKQNEQKPAVSWTIQDARPGDILNSARVQATIIFKGFSHDGKHIDAYCALQKGFFIAQELPWDRDFEPATQFWKNALFDAMVRKGYLWDAENKRLNKAVQKPAEKQEYSGLTDLERAILRGFLATGVENVPVAIIKETANECLAQMKPAEWSEEDKMHLNNAILAAEKEWGAESRTAKFLKSLRPHWKPSEEQPMPDSTQLIAEWEKEKAVLEQKDFRSDAERMAYNAFLDGFVKGIGYGRTK